MGDMPTPEPGAGEVRIRLAFSGINPGDVKKRSGWQGSPMPFPRVVPHSDGAGVIDAVGAGVPATRVGETVWCYTALCQRDKTPWWRSIFRCCTIVCRPGWLGGFLCRVRGGA